MLALSLSMILLIFYDYHQALESERSAERVSVIREAAKIITELEESEVRVVVENSNNRDIPLLELIDVVPEFLVISGKPAASIVLPRGTAAAFSYRVRPLLPGNYNFNKLEMRVFGPLGFFMTRKWVSSYTTLVVLPHFSEVKTALKSAERLWGLLVRGKAMGGMYDLADFREYSPGDDYRKIVWKAYARTGRLYIREDFGEVSARVLLVLDLRAWDWSLGTPPNTLASVELRTLRSFIHSFARYGISTDLAVCCSATAKVVRSATEDVGKALADVFSYITPSCRCTSHMGIYTEVPTYMGRSPSEYVAVILIANPVSIAVENPNRFSDLIRVYGSRLRIVIPRFDYELYVDQDAVKSLYSFVSSLVEKAGGGFEVLEESMILRPPVGGSEKWK